MSDYLQVPKIMPPLQVIHFSAAGNLIPQLNVHHIPQFVNPPLPLKTVVSVFWFFVSAGLRVQTTTLFFLVADALSGRLGDRGGVVDYHDPFISSISLEHAGGHGSKNSVPFTEAAVREADFVVIVTDHSDFDYTMLARSAKLIVDTRNAMAKAGSNSGNTRIVKL